MKYFGYILNSNNSEFGMILYDSKNVNKCLIPAHEIIESIKEEIAIKFEFTVSIGTSRLNEDDFGMSDDWYGRVFDNLETAQKCGGNQVCFGSDGYGRMESKVDNTTIDLASDVIQMKSLETIEVCFNHFI